MDRGVRASIGPLIRLLIIIIGTIVIIQTAGIDLNALTKLAAALGVGIGGYSKYHRQFYLRPDYPFRKTNQRGDRIEVADIQGNVMSISFRATQVLTNDIPSKVINWSRNDRNIRFRIPAGMSYNEDHDEKTHATGSIG